MKCGGRRADGKRCQRNAGEGGYCPSHRDDEDAAGGRPTELTEGVQEKICDAIRAGNYLAEAAEYAGIGRTTFYRWIERGEKEPEGLYRDFRDAVKKAERDAEAHAVAIVRKAMPGDWKAAMTYLERRFPDRWARRERREHTGPEGGPIVVSEEAFADPKLREALRDAGRRLGADS